MPAGKDKWRRESQMAVCGTAAEITHCEVENRTSHCLRTKRSSSAHTGGGYVVPASTMGG